MRVEGGVGVYAAVRLRMSMHWLLQYHHTCNMKINAEL